MLNQSRGRLMLRMCSEKFAYSTLKDSAKVLYNTSSLRFSGVNTP